jgi:hypothetical protein
MLVDHPDPEANRLGGRADHDGPAVQPDLGLSPCAIATRDATLIDPSRADRRRGSI